MKLPKPLVHLLDLDDAGFRRYFAKTPVRRAGDTRFLRNVLIAAGNSGEASLSVHVERHLTNASPLVRGMAIWALRELLDEQDYNVLRTAHSPSEEDDSVLDEWDLSRAK